MPQFHSILLRMRLDSNIARYYQAPGSVWFGWGGVQIILAWFLLTLPRPRLISFPKLLHPLLMSFPKLLHPLLMFFLSLLYPLLMSFRRLLPPLLMFFLLLLFPLLPLLISLYLLTFYVIIKSTHLVNGEETYLRITSTRICSCCNCWCATDRCQGGAAASDCKTAVQPLKLHIRFRH